MERSLAWFTVFLAPYGKEHLRPEEALDGPRSLQARHAASTTRCKHDTLPVRVLPVGGGKKIAHCRGCGRSGPVAESSAEALAALRGLQSPFFVGPPIAARGTGAGSKR